MLGLGQKTDYRRVGRGLLGRGKKSSGGKNYMISRFPNLQEKISVKK
jgi:hypothetical protein